MVYTINQPMQLPADEQEMIALNLLRKINDEVQNDFLTPQQEEELNIALEEVRTSNYNSHTIDEMKDILSKWHK